MAHRDTLIQSIKVRHKTLKNRIVFGAHTANMSVNGYPDARHIGYYVERAIGGAAMIVVEPMPVHQTAILTRGNFRPNDDSVIPYFKKLTDAVKKYDTVILQQLYHVGAHGDADNSYAPNFSPSGGHSYHDSDGSHEMSIAEIDDMVQSYVDAAVRCQKAGFDGVDLFAAYHSLLDQFWSSWSNKRAYDEYGGSLENRTRLSRRIVEEIRKACGENFIIGMSLSWSEKTPWLISLDEFKEIVALHDESGDVDYFSCGSGNYFDVERIMPTFVDAEKMGVPLSAALKEVVKNAKVTAESHIRTPDLASSVIGSNQADLVSIVRGQIADPHWVSKMSEEREDDIRGCISCNQMCWGRRSRDYYISCLINPSAGREFEVGGDRFAKAERSKNILVVGAGPAGLEAARVAAERGHKVTLCEAQPEIGGQFRFAGMAPRRGQITELIHWYQRQLEHLQIDVRYSTYLDDDDIVAFGADEVVMATGSRTHDAFIQRWLPNEESLPGIENGNVYGCDEVYLNHARLGEEVIILDEGGNWKGMGTAWLLADRGHRISVVTPDALFGKELQRTMADSGIRIALAQRHVEVITESAITHWHGKRAEITSLLNGEVREIAASAIVSTMTNIPNDELVEPLREQKVAVHAIGDCLSPRQAPYAFYEGRMMGLKL